MPVISAYAQSNKHNVMQDTWGHLYPEPGTKHPCKILVMHHEGDTTVLDRSSEVPCSPIEFQLVCSVIDLFDWTNGLHEVDCVLWFFKTCNDMYLGEAVGKIIKAKVTVLHDTTNWGE